MPLSEDEQRILREIEQQFYATDPDFAKGVGETSLARHALRQMKFAGLLFVVGVVVLVWLLVAGTFWLSFAFGAVPMFAAALWFEANLRRLGRAGLAQVTQNMRGGGIRDALGNVTKRTKDRFKPDEE